MAEKETNKDIQDKNKEFSIRFSNDDFFNEAQKELVLSTLQSKENTTKFIKEAIIYRSLLENEDETKYRNLMKILQVKGLDFVAQAISTFKEKDEYFENYERKIENVVRKILEQEGHKYIDYGATHTSPRPTVNNHSEIPTEKIAKHTNTVKEKRKPSAKLRDLS